MGNADADPRDQAPYVPAAGGFSPLSPPNDLYARITRKSWMSILRRLPVTIGLATAGGVGGLLLAGPPGVLGGLFVAWLVDCVLQVRYGGSAYSYTVMRQPMLDELSAHYGTRFESDWRVGYAHGKARGDVDLTKGDDSADFGFLRLAPGRLEYYGIRSSFVIPAEQVVDVGLAPCSKARLVSTIALCREARRPYVTYRTGWDTEHSLNFEPMDGGGWPGIMRLGRVLAEGLARWAQGARGGTSSEG